jgi:hypothetical protein
LWNQEEIGCRLQEGVKLRNSGMAQEKRLQKNWDSGNVWTAEETNRCTNKDDPPCKNGMAQGKLHQKGLDQEPGTTRNPERMNGGE